MTLKRHPAVLASAALAALAVMGAAGLQASRWKSASDIEALTTQADAIARDVRQAHRSFLNYAGVSSRSDLPGLTRVTDGGFKTASGRLLQLSAVDSGGGPASGFSVTFSDLDASSCASLAGNRLRSPGSITLNGVALPKDVSDSDLADRCAAVANVVAFTAF